MQVVFVFFFLFVPEFILYSYEDIVKTSFTLFVW